jgi:hypothetical protein
MVLTGDGSSWPHPHEHTPCVRIGKGLHALYSILILHVCG